MPHEISGKRSAVYTDELVVASEHLGLVMDALAAEGVDTGSVEQSAELGLALIPLPNVARAAADLAAKAPASTSPPAGGTEGTEGADQRTEIDVVLEALRASFDERYVGWVPTMGKNRLVGDVTGGGGKISHGGDTMPNEVKDSLDPRGSGPGQGVRVGVLDTGIAAHPWLAGGWTAAAGAVLT